ncbi:MAG: terpene cyclase/mutase family protein [Actinomycetota bacterium]|nr:terpene cyclase/mutase family protein [Actinomycetota bacterium]
MAPAARPTRRTWRTALAGMTALALGSALVIAQQASAAPGGPDAQKAVGYLTAPGQLVDGHYYDAYGLGRADWGLTIDGAYALAAQGGNDTAYSKLVDFLATNGKDPAGTDVVSWTGIGTDYLDGGSVGKLALLAEAAGRDPHSFAGQDLIAALAKATCTGAAPIGKSTCNGNGNYAGGSSVFKQAVGIIGQVRGGAGEAAVAQPAAYLLGLQNANGGWASLIPSGGGGSDIDSTAMAVMALSLVPGDAAAGAAQRGIAWVAGTQLSDGAFPGFAPPGSEPAHSTNSTALALQVLRLSAANHTAQTAKALAFLATTQNRDGGFDIDSANDGSDVRATTQVVSGTVGRSYATLLRDLGARSHAVTGAAYLVGKLTDGTHLESSFDNGDGTVTTFIDYGLTADLALALASTESQNASLAKVVGYLRAHVGDYVDQKGSIGGPYGGGAGKLAVLAESTGQNPTSFGGVDLLKVLTDNVCTTDNSDPKAFDPCSAAGDFRGAFSGSSQAFGVLALGRAGVAVPAPALTRLGQLQCADGGFSSTLIAPGTACTSEVDTTGYALQALSLQPTSQAAVARGWEYLRTVQGADGGWAGASGVNANSTGLATQAVLALLEQGGYVGTGAGARVKAATTAKPKVAAAVAAVAGGATPAGSVEGAQAAFTFLLGLQRAGGGFDVSAPQPGDDGARIRATTQAVPALSGAFLTTTLDRVTPVGPPPTSTTTTTTAPSTTSTSTALNTSTTTTATSTGTTTSTTSSTSSASSSATTSPTTSPTSSGRSTSAGSGTDPSGPTANGDLAHTGTPVSLVVGIALLLLFVGLVLLVGGRLSARRGRL